MDVMLNEELDLLDDRFEKGLEVFLGLEAVSGDDEFGSKLCSRFLRVTYL